MAKGLGVLSRFATFSLKKQLEARFSVDSEFGSGSNKPVVVGMVWGFGWGDGLRVGSFNPLVGMGLGGLVGWLRVVDGYSPWGNKVLKLILMKLMHFR